MFATSQDSGPPVVAMPDAVPRARAAVPPAEPAIAILMGTANGASFLGEQLESLRAQTHRNWRLYASDDGSSDDTVARLHAFGETLGPGRVTVRPGPRRGFAVNFLSLACDASIDADYFAFCDQDDVWHPDRLARSVAALRERPHERPLLYCARTRYVDREGRLLGLSPLFSEPPAFANALVQNLGGGNTMLFNRATRALIMRVGIVEVVAHDWWLYQLVTACGGEVLYDPTPSVDYRQHAANLIGSNAGMAARWWRGKELLKGRFKRWNDVNERALRQAVPLMAPANREVFETFERGRRGGMWGRVASVSRAGLYRQTLLGNAGLWAAALMGRL